MNLIFFSGGEDRDNPALNSELVRLIGKRARITFIPANGRESDGYFEHFRKSKSRYGLKRHLFFPLDVSFTRKALNEAFASDAIFLSGGNTFTFLHQLRHHGLLDHLRKYAHAGNVLFGLSAGSIMMTPTITIAGLVPDEADDNDAGIKNLHALNLVNFEVYPHYAESAASIRHLLTYSKHVDYPIYAFPDGSGITVIGAETSFVGKVTCFFNGKSFRV